ncbi:MAG: BatA domain-containing protein [Rubripirellula sp.]
MTFLNGLLAFGALAFTVPLAIHLLFRSRFRTLEWGAMHLLDSVVRINRRRIQLLHLLLLLLRCLLPVLLALCLARPILTGFQALPGDAPQTLILAIDDSRSMSAMEDADSTGSRMQRVKQGLREVLEDLTRRDEVILIRASDIATPAAAMGVQEAMQQVRDLRPEFGPVDLDRLIRAAVDAADEASHPQRRIVVASDFQNQMVHGGVIDSFDRLAVSLAEKPIQPVISFWNLGIDSQTLSNVSVDSVQLDSPAVVAGRNARFSARVRSSSDTPIRDLRLVWSIDGKPLEPRTVTIPPRSTITSRLTRNLEDAGIHQVTVSVEHGDALVADNRRSIAVDVIQEIKVLLVDGKPSSQPLEAETDYLAIALSPFAFGGEDQPDAVRTSVVTANQIVKGLDEQQPDIVILANVDRLSGEPRKRLSQFVLDGGGLIVFDGKQLDTKSYNEPWMGESSSWQLPAKLGAIHGSQDAQNSSPLPVGTSNPLYSPWNVLGSEEQRLFGDVDVYSYRKLGPAGSDPSIEAEDNGTAGNDALSGDGSSSDPMADNPAELDESATTLLSMANGDPIVLSARRGRGRVMQFAIPCDTAWSTLPMRLVYLPMMQQLVLDLAGSRKRTTLDIGKAFSVPISELTALIPDGTTPETNKTASYTLEFPGQTETELQPTNETSPQLTIPSTSVGGNYIFRQTTPMKDAESVVTSTLRVVEVPPSESQLRDTEPNRLAAIAKPLEANIYTNVSELQEDDRTRRHGREIWRWLLVGLLVAMIAELLLQQRASRVGAT